MADITKALHAGQVGMADDVARAGGVVVLRGLPGGSAKTLTAALAKVAADGGKVTKITNANILRALFRVNACLVQHIRPTNSFKRTTQHFTPLAKCNSGNGFKRPLAAFMTRCG